MKSIKFFKAVSKITFILVGVLSSFITYAQSARDYITLKNGDVVSGRITKMNDSIVNMSSVILGDIVIKRSTIQAITLNSTQNPSSGSSSTLPRPSYTMPLWYKTIGVGINSLSGNFEIGRRIKSTRIITFVKPSIQHMPNYQLTTIPLECGFGIYDDTLNKRDFVQLHGGYAFRILNDEGDDWYKPGPVYGFDYRHVFVSRYTPSRGSYIELGYEGGVLKRNIGAWDTERVVNRHRFRFGFGIVF